MRRNALIAIVAALAAAAPAGAMPARGDVLTQLGGGSPSCRQDVGAAGRTNCAATGSVATTHPIENYGLDIHVPVGITHLDNAFGAALQNLGAMIWMGLVYLVKGALLLLEWAFSIDLLSSAMSAVRSALDTLHNKVLGDAWFIAAISVVALWGIWRGLVQHQTTRTIGGLAATVGLMLVALVVLARPDDTVGYASRLANNGALGFLSAATAQPLAKPARSLADASQSVFASVVRAPWCALEFGSVDYCDLRPPRGPGSSTPTVADAWLSEPPDGDGRDLLYHGLKGDSIFAARIAKDPQRVKLQEAGGTFTRLGLLALIAVGMLGAVALLAYLGIRLLLAGVLALLLLLFAPAMLLAPAFGETGRATFVGWFKRLAGAIAAKLIYALFLAVVLAAASALARLPIGWLGVWLLQITFWWGVLIKRHDLIGLVSAGHQDEERHRGVISSLAQGYYAVQLGRTAMAATRRLRHAPVRTGQILAHGGRAVRDRRADRTAAGAVEELDAQGRRVLLDGQQRARTALADRVPVERELRVLDRRLTGFDEEYAAARATGRPIRLPTAEQSSLLRRRRALLEQLNSPELRSASQIVTQAERNQAQTGEPITGRDLAAYRARRAADHAANLPTDHDRHVRAAGIDPGELAAADPAQRPELLDRVKRHLAREKQLLDKLPAEPAAGQRELRVDPAAIRTRRAQRPGRHRERRP